MMSQRAPRRQPRLQSEDNYKNPAAARLHSEDHHPRYRPMMEDSPFLNEPSEDDQPAIDVSGINKSIPAQRQVIFYQRVQVKSGLKYWVELSFTKTKVYFILFPKQRDFTDFIDCSLPLKIADKLMKQDANLCAEFVKRIQVKYGKIQISGYHVHR